MPTTFEWSINLLLPLILTFVSFNLLSEGSASYFGQWCLLMFLDATYGHLFHVILLIPARRIASLLPGSKMPPLNDEKRLSEQEEQADDPSIVWPSPDVIAKLPEDWVVQRSNQTENDASEIHETDNIPKTSHSTNKKKRSLKNKNKSSSTTCNQNPNPHSNQPKKPIHTQPYYLNHVRGSTRVRHASQRIAAAIGTLCSTYLLCSFSSRVTLDDIGLGIPSAKRVLSDITLGIIVGASIVIFIFTLELKMGWIKVIGYCDTVVPKEMFTITFAWDILFHLGVSINEEVMWRGWMFILGCRGLLLGALDWFDDPSSAAVYAIVTSIALQSTMFSLLHLYSPGSTTVSLLNLFLGGIAASLNFMVAGGTLWLGIGWHFGWNIFMGHILGRSTSGIPISCSVVSVLPRPAYDKFHGGTFGPEQGVLAPLAYILGMAMVIILYGWDDLVAWKEHLVIESRRF
ncbi:hypothetical protein ACHAXR_005456 [Thalassiosira sp. AJA248-18]